MELTLNSKHELIGSGYFIGVDHENISEQLIINVEPEELLDKWAYIEFEVNGLEKHNTPRIDITDNQIIYDIPNGLLQNGYVTVQVIFRDDTNFLWKSYIKKFHVANSINACQNLPEEYPDFITEAQKLLDEVSIDADLIDEVIETEAARVGAENIRVSNENTRIANENTRILTETERSNKEVERISNEEIRQQNETQRVNAETNRETTFNTWTNAIGQLPTYDSRLTNLETSLDTITNLAPETLDTFSEVAKVIQDNGEVITTLTAATETNANNISTLNDQVNDIKTTQNDLSNALKGTASGEVIRVDDVSNVEHNVKVKVQGKNLIPFPYAENSAIKNGISFTVNNDGSVTANGTATNNTAFTFLVNENISVSGDYTISGITGGSKDTYYIQPYIDNIAQKILTDGSYSYNWEGVLTRCTMYIMAGCSINNLIIKPQLEVGKVATEYTPYVNSLDITFTKCGDNLINAANIVIGGINAIGENVEITTSYRTEDYIPVTKNMFFSYDNFPQISIGLFAYDKNKKFISNLTFKSTNNPLQQLLVNEEVAGDVATYVRFVINSTELPTNMFLSATETKFSKYKEFQCYTPNVDGTLNITSTAPTMTLFTDKDVNIEAEYNQDINVVIKNLQDTIKSLTQ